MRHAHVAPSPFPVARLVTDMLVPGVSGSQPGGGQGYGPTPPAAGTARWAKLRRLAVLALASLVLCLVGHPSLAYGLTYYVAPGGHDGNAGTQSSPWASIQRAADVMVAGDTVVIAPGVYIEAVDITRSGTPGAYITYQAMPGAVMESPDPSQSLEGLDIGSGVAYIRLQGFEIRGGFYKAILVDEGAHHVEILDCNLHHNHAGISWLGSSYGLVERCQIHDNDGGGMGFRYGAHDIVVRDTVSYNHNDGLGCSGDADGFAANETAYNLTFERAEAFGNSEDGFDLKAANVVIDRSLSHDNNCVGVKLWNTARLQNSLVYGNGRGLALTSIVSGGGTVVRLINNTIADNTNLAIGVGGSSDKLYAVELFNNVVSGNNKLLDFLDCMTLTENFNLFHRPDPLADHLIKRIGCVATGASVGFSGAAINSGVWYAQSGQGAQSRAADPLYVNLLAGDLSLQPASPALDAGWATVAPAVDIEGTPRPQASGVDIGAYEATGLVSLSVITVGSGTVTSSPGGISCGADCSALFSPDAVVTLTAIPGATSTFATWSGAGCGTANPCTTVVSANVQITATFTTTVTPADLIVTLVGLPPASAAPGDTFSASDTVANQGGSTTTLGTTSRYYLSLDAVRGGPDILLTGSRAVPILAANATSAGGVSVTIPSSTTPATYYLLACADDPAQVPESDEANNCRAAAATVQVTAPPKPPAPAADLVVSLVGNPPASAAPASSFTARDWGLNQGGGPAGPSVTRYYLSLDTARDDADIRLSGSRAVGALVSGQAYKGSVTVTVPSAISPGLYYLLACADDLAQVTETNDANNCGASQARVQVALGDLVVTAVGNPPASAAAGSSFAASDWVLNQGAGAAGPSVTRYHLSFDTARDAADTLMLGSRAVITLRPGQTSKGSVSVTVPASTTPGLYYLLACADDVTQVREADDANNCRASQTKVQVGSN